MNSKIFILAISLVLATVFVSCEKDNNVKPVKGAGKNYIINYGTYGGDKGGVSVFNSADTTVTNNHYYAVNSVPSTSNVQYAYYTNGNVYMMGNNVDKIFYVDAESFEQTTNGITGNSIIKPRNCVANNNILYVSCWGGDIWTDPTLSFITKIDLNTHEVLGTIELDGGPEGLEIANGKLYAALNYDKKIAVIKLDDETISYIDAPAVSMYFKKDQNDNLYVSLVSSFSVAADQEGLGYINTQTDELTVYNLTGISSSAVNVFEFNKDKSKLYVMTSAYDANWNLTGAIAVFNTTSKSFEQNMLASNISGLNGLAINKSTDDIFYFISNGGAANGKMVMLKNDGTFVKELETGINPSMMLSIE